MPIVLYPHPGINKHSSSTVGPLLYVVTLALVLSLVGVALLNWKAEGPVGFGASFSTGTAFVLAIVAFETSPTTLPSSSLLFWRCGRRRRSREPHDAITPSEGWL
jgi:hypothetical protein